MVAELGSMIGVPGLMNQPRVQPQSESQASDESIAFIQKLLDHDRSCIIVIEDADLALYSLGSHISHVLPVARPHLETQLRAKPIPMDELQKKLNQRHDARPRKVRFKISSAYSGRVLKQVYEDGQELEIPQEEYPHRLRKCSFEPRDHLFGIREAQEPRRCPPAKLSAQRISVFREGSKYTLTSSPSLLKEYQANDNRRHPPILDFGKIIIYTSNLKIIRTSMNKKELVRKLIQNDSVDDWSLTHREEKGENSNNKSDGDKKDTGHQLVLNQDMQLTINQPSHLPQDRDDENSCAQCKGSGSAPCSVCHGSKFSMLANRFKESYRALRCPACNENGLQPCQTCAP